MQPEEQAPQPPQPEPEPTVEEWAGAEGSVAAPIVEAAGQPPSPVQDGMPVPTAEEQQAVADAAAIAHNEQLARARELYGVEAGPAAEQGAGSGVLSVGTSVKQDIQAQADEHARITEGIQAGIAEAIEAPAEPFSPPLMREHLHPITHQISEIGSRVVAVEQYGVALRGGIDAMIRDHRDLLDRVEALEKILNPIVEQNMKMGGLTPMTPEAYAPPRMTDAQIEAAQATQDAHDLAETNRLAGMQQLLDAIAQEPAPSGKAALADAYKSLRGY